MTLMKKLHSFLVASLLLTLSASLCANDLKLASLFSDHMVLQRDQPVPVWGWADPGEAVTVEFGVQKKTATADSEGKWMVKLDPMPASAKPETLSVVAANPKSKNLKSTDILVGDVWLCSGQSNMAFGVTGSLNAEEEIAKARYPSIRFFRWEAVPASSL